MTFSEARASRRTYLAVGGLTFISGAVILLVTVVKELYIIADQRGGFGAGNIKAVVGWIYEHGIVVSPLWPWVSDTGFDGAFSIPFSPSAILGVALFIAAGFLFRPAAQLKRWINDVKKLLAKEAMANSQRSQPQSQSTGNVSSGRDTNISQQITNHYNHRPDNPRIAIIVASIGVLAAIIAALLKAYQKSYKAFISSIYQAFGEQLMNSSRQIYPP